MVEGHTRLQAAKNAGLGWVWVFEREFGNDDEALVYAIQAQSNRRNLDARELILCQERLGAAIARQQGKRNNFVSEDTKLDRLQTMADRLGVSRMHVARTEKVIADPEAKAAVMTGQTSITRAYQQVREKERHQKEAAAPKAAPVLIPGMPPSAVRGIYTVGEWKALSERDRQFLLTEHPAQSSADYNRTNENVEWALWTWNPVTGCLHECPYCYARDIANRFYPQGFAPAFVPGRLHAPRTKKVPAAAATNLGEKNVFTCSMADLFGKWVPQAWIDAVFAETARATDWNFLYLTKFPQGFK